MCKYVLYVYEVLKIQWLGYICTKIQTKNSTYMIENKKESAIL
jgi:hypothetical protein